MADPTVGSMGEPASNPIVGAATQAIQQNPSGVKGFFAKLGQGIHDAAPQIEELGARLAQAGGNPGPALMLQQKRQLALQQQQSDQNFGLAQARENELAQTGAAQRAHLSQEDALNNPDNPLFAKREAANLKYQGDLAEQAKLMAPPTDRTGSIAGGPLQHFQTKYTGNDQYQTTPVTVPGTPVPNPDIVNNLPPSPGAVVPGTTPKLPVPPTVTPQEPLLAAPKLGAPVTEPTKMGSTTGYDHVWYANGQPMARAPEALPPYAQQAIDTTTTQTQTGPNGVNQINTTQVHKKPSSSNTAPPSNGNSTPPTMPPTPPKGNGGGPTTPPPMNFKITGPEAKQIMDQDVALNATMKLANNIRQNKKMFASMLDGGKIQIASDPNKGLIGNIISRNLTPQESIVAGDFQSLMEHINTMRLALQAQGFRGPEAFNALQAQRGNLMQNPTQVDRVLGNTVSVIQGLLANHQKLLNPPSKGANPRSSLNPPASSPGGAIHF